MPGCAWKLGDDTAEREGRLTLNPLAHMDPIGTLLLPLLGAPFGWAKPVPVNMGRFHRSVGLRSGIVLTVGAGPISNICLAFLSGALLLAAALVCGGIESVPRPLHAFLDTLLILNVALALFNLVPVPPLDGSRLLDCVVPDACRGAWDVSPPGPSGPGPFRRVTSVVWLRVSVLATPSHGAGGQHAGPVSHGLGLRTSFIPETSSTSGWGLSALSQSRRRHPAALP